jgi:hypothetical protein
MCRATLLNALPIVAAALGRKYGIAISFWLILHLGLGVRAFQLNACWGVLKDAFLALQRKE